jgi:hypothetical protein
MVYAGYRHITNVPPNSLLEANVPRLQLIILHPFFVEKVASEPLYNFFISPSIKTPSRNNIKPVYIKPSTYNLAALFCTVPLTLPIVSHLHYEVHMSISH